MDDVRSRRRTSASDAAIHGRDPVPPLIWHPCIGALCSAVKALVILAVVSGESSAQISVGENVQVSIDRPALSHNEVMGRAHPKQANRMIACAQGNDVVTGRRPSAAYLTTDGGTSWQHVITKTNAAGFGDPVCLFTRGDTALFVLLTNNPPRTMVYRSVDGGLTWPDSARFGFIDREYATFDGTGGKYDGRIYVSGTRGVGTMDPSEPAARGFSLYRSVDGGKTFLGPVARVTTSGRYVMTPGPSVVLSDGTVGFLVPVMNDWSPLGPGPDFRHDAERANAKLVFFTSTDGGESLSTETIISDYWMNAWPWRPHNAGTVPFMAVDPGSAAFKDRIYVVWSDRRTGRDRIMFSYSSDKGKTWSPTRVIEDGPVPIREREWDNIHPTVAVSKDGVVGVSWYDRRDNPDNIGWYVRFTASLDGGNTWLPSVRVSEKPSDPGNPKGWIPRGWGGVGTDKGLSLNIGISTYDFRGGDTDEMLVDANGVFHPVWIDNRTGVHQVWTAPVTVRGKVVKNGTDELAALVDRTASVKAIMRQTDYDHERREVRSNVQLQNISEDTLQAPLMARVIGITSELGTPTLLAADKGRPGPGAIFDFTPLMRNGQLLPGEKTSGGVDVVIRLDDLRSLWQRGQIREGLAKIDLKVFAGPSGATAELSQRP